eukprot:1010696-Rhodomonas_salina.1
MDHRMSPLDVPRGRSIVTKREVWQLLSACVGSSRSLVVFASVSNGVCNLNLTRRFRRPVSPGEIPLLGGPSIQHAPPPPKIALRF